MLSCCKGTKVFRGWQMVCIVLSSCYKGLPCVKALSLVLWYSFPCLGFIVIICSYSCSCCCSCCQKIVFFLLAKVFCYEMNGAFNGIIIGYFILLCLYIFVIFLFVIVVVSLILVCVQRDLDIVTGVEIGGKACVSSWLLAFPFRGNQGRRPKFYFDTGFSSLEVTSISNLHHMVV